MCRPHLRAKTVPEVRGYEMMVKKMLQELVRYGSLSLLLSLITVLPANSATETPATIDISGAGFSGATSVTFDGLSSAFVVVTDKLIKAKAPIEIVGKRPVKIEVITPGGAVSFTYVPPVASSIHSKRSPLTLMKIEPSFGPESGGTLIRIKGSGFANRGSLNVLFDGQQATAISRLRDDELVAITPPHTAGVSRLMVKGLDGWEAVLDKAFTFVAPPTVTAVSPSNAPVTGGATVMIRGEGFSTQGEVTVMFGNAPSKQVVVKSSSELVVTTPPYVEGPLDIKVTNPDGQYMVSTGLFAYLPMPSITSVGPVLGK